MLILFLCKFYILGPAEAAERQRRLQQFQGARSISSAAYYDRDEGKKFTLFSFFLFHYYYYYCIYLFFLPLYSVFIGQMPNGSDSDLSAAELARRLAVTAKADLNSVKDLASQGAKKISSYLSDLSDRYNG